MRVLNAMFGRKKGGIEQAFVDYSRSLFDLGCEVTAVAYQDAQIIKSLPEEINIKTFTNFGQWDPLAVWKLKKLVREIDPEIVITHGNRAKKFFEAINYIPVVNVCHNYNIKQHIDSSNLITVTEDLKRTYVKKGADESKIYVIPNMVYLPSESQAKEYAQREVPVIGAMGRFVIKKGFNIYLKALSILKARGVNFKAILAGEGTEGEKLKKLAAKLNIEDLVSFPGWIENKKEFFDSIDIFCLPSLHEPFGIVILEAFINSTPVISTDTEGPIEIIKPYINGMMVEAGEADTLADAIEKLILNPKLIERIGREGFNTVRNNYDSKMVGKKLHDVLEKILTTWKANHDSSIKSPDMVE